MSTLASIILLTATITASPTASFEIHQNSRTSLQAASNSMEYKRSVQVHPWKRDSGAVGKQITVPLVNSANQLYNCKVTFGNGQVFNMDLDTGSADTWVRGPGCKSPDDSCTGASLAIDASMVDMKAGFQVRYGTGSASGIIYQAPVSIGPFVGVLPIGMSSAEAAMGTITDGLLGLAFNPLSKISRATGLNANFMDSLFGNSDNNMVSFYLPTLSTAVGQVTFGGMNVTKFTGPMSFVPINDDAFWQFQFTGSTFSVGGVTGDLAATFKNATVDSGSTIMMIAAEPAAAINKAIGATLTAPQNPGMGFFPSCATALQGPPISITVGGGVFSIPAAAYVSRDDKDPNVCFSGIAGKSPGGESVAILGDTFIKAVYTVFDKSRSRIGFAQSVDVLVN